ncbi:hypothetical protein PR048_017191 [Dryococelus australis]|uniref:HAT C-terminal dimerisation domain-containing protein n=1 Tax=Dryococelus australis TaxID=614101 RepID=A0ABQ9H8Y3_9NEOP|nr:hypothetical protein PR048_017191 [Dryococelus australis]
MLVAGAKVLNNVNSTECSRASVLFRLTVPNIWLNLVGNIWSIELVALNECLVKTKIVFINTRKRKHHYLHHLQESNVNPKLFPSPVVTRWNLWFHAVEDLDDYLTHLVTFFKKENILKCQFKFVVEHCKQTVDLKILEGSSYPFAHKFHSNLSDFKTCFELVSDWIFGPATSCFLANPSCLKASTAAKLAATGQKLGADPAKLILENVGRLYDPRNIIAKGPGVDALDLKHCLFCLYHCSKYWKSMPQQDKLLSMQVVVMYVLAILLSLKNDFQEYSCCAVRCLFIPVANADSERAFSQYNNMTDICTALKEDNIEIMLGMCFDAV